jgi:hypothetical protein
MDANPNAYCNTDTVDACGSERTKRSQSDFEQLYGALEQRCYNSNT